MPSGAPAGSVAKTAEGRTIQALKSRAFAVAAFMFEAAFVI